ncbi:MAG TPA: hypothetical protein VGJ25_09320 [Gaiellaceae bacterium]
MRTFGTVAAVAAGLALGTLAVDSPGAGTSFPCRWHWDLRSGMPKGQVVAGFTTDCSGYRGGGSLTIAARLLKWNPESKSWRVEKAQTQRWTSFEHRRFVELRKPCTAGSFKAAFNAVLRSPSGVVAGTVSVKSGALRVVVPCIFGIG